MGSIMKHLLLMILLTVSVNIFSSNSSISLKNLDNKSVEFGDYLGKKVTLVNFWATWCTPCKTELPLLNKIYQKYNKDGFEVLSVSMDESSEFPEVKSTAFTMKLKFNVLLDPEGAAADSYNPSRNAPYSILFDRNGNIIKKFLGFHAGDEELLENEIKKLLKAPKSDEEVSKFKYQFSNSTNYIQYDENDAAEGFSNYEMLQTRTNLLLSYDFISFSTLLHTNHFLSTSLYMLDRIDNNKTEEGDLRAEKITLKAKYWGQNITAGDYHVTQGKGLALSLNKQDDLGIDTTLRGLKLDLNYDDFIELNMFGGFVNNTNLDTNEKTNTIFEDKNDIITGASLKFNINNLILNAHYNQIMFDEADFKESYPKPNNYEQQIIETLGFGVSFNNLFSKLSGSVEVNFLDDNFYEDEYKVKDAYAYYGDLTFLHNNLSITQEFKMYKDFQLGFHSDFESNNRFFAPDPNTPDIGTRSDIDVVGKDNVYYNSLPALERLNERATDTNEDTFGTRTKIKYKLSDHIKLYANYLYSVYTHDEHDDVLLHHIYGGTEYSFNKSKSKVDFSLSYRHEKDTEYDKDPSGKTYYTYYGFNFDSNLYINSILSFTLKSFYRKTTKLLTGYKTTKNYDDAEANFGVILINDIYLSYYLARFTEKKDKSYYQAFEVKYQFLTDSFIKLFYGEIKGGKKCLGGVCKNYPDFKGLKAEFVIGF
jgi:thiol-disulfide isomerase/thioredoxin